MGFRIIVFSKRDCRVGLALCGIFLEDADKNISAFLEERLIVINPYRWLHHLGIHRRKNTTTEFSLQIALVHDANNSVERGNKFLTGKKHRLEFCASH